MTRKIFAAPIAALALIAAAPVPSAALASNSQSQNASGQSGEAPAAKGERKICKTFHMSGSHARPERLCMTRAQWKEFDAAQDDN